MSRCTIVAELATTHGGDLDIAKDLISAAADAGADFAKVQSYSLSKLNPRDPQRDWLRQAHLDKVAHARLMDYASGKGLRFLSTPFDSESLQMLRDLGLKTFKIASSESGHTWWQPQPGETWYVSFPWGNREPKFPHKHIGLTAIPLYPTPLEAVGKATLLEGWSDHGVGLDACLWALGRGIEVLEAHLTLGNGRGRQMPFDKTPAQMARLREFADNMGTLTTGVATHFRERWSA